MPETKKQIVLTGASRGLGLALAEGFVACGHTVFGCSRSEAAVAALQERWPEPHRFAAVDVADDGQVHDWAHGVLADKGAEWIPDLLINNAALINRNAPLWKVPVDEFSAIIDVNIKGVTNVIRHFVPAMVARQSGVIVNLSSGWGRSVSADVAPYCASKWAIEGLTRALAEDLPAGMAAVPLNPGVINTEMLQSCFGSEATGYPDPQAWAETAVPFILNFGPDDNGKPLRVPFG